MFLALILVPIVGIFVTGGLGETVASIQAVNPEHLNLFASTATVAGVISAVAWGLGYFGQPHIIVRFMAIKSVKETKQARRIGIGWMILSLFGAIGTALVGLAYFQQNDMLNSDFDAETIFISMGQILFHPFIAGIMLAAILAAIMSTIASQLIVTSSALVEDIYKALFNKTASDKHYVAGGRIAVLIVAIVAFFLALDPENSILDLVGFAWAGFGAAFGPVILLALYWRKLTNIGALAGMIVGAVVAYVWGTVPAIKENFFGLYEIVPGFVLGLIAAVIVSLITYKPNAEIEKEFDETLALLKSEREK
ncbi:SSF-domain-containing protein [Rhizophagus irregularis]|nr:SSF-domain-containing protein [Rhizophagus irregularis]